MDDEEKKARKERMKDYRRRYREKHGIVEKRRPWKKAIGAVAALCVLAFAGFFAAQSAAADRVTLDGQPVRDWTEEQARQYVDDKEGELKGRTIRLTGEDIDETIDFDDLELQFDKEKIFDDVYLVGRRGTPWQRLNDVVATLRFGKDVPLSLKVDEEKLDERVQQIHDVYDKAPENAYAVPNSDNKTVSIHKEKDRIVLDDAGLKQQIHDQLDRGVTEDMEAPVQSREEAAVKEGDLKDIDTVLSYYTTHFDDSNKDRNENIAIAQKRLNHALVPAQKDFSFNGYVGTRTRDKGYKDAPVYFDNKLVPDAGGGVCQVSTTLFNAVLRAGLFIAGRAPHFAPAAYVPVGMDATVADNSLDFAFTNPFQHPVYIYTVAGANTVTTYILGNHADTCTTTFQTIHLQNLPHKVIRKHNDAVTSDVCEQVGYDGHDIVIRRTVNYTDGDKYTDTIESHYAPNDEIIVTNGQASETVVQTSDLQPQDVLINAPHDMFAF